MRLKVQTSILWTFLIFFFIVFVGFGLYFSFLLFFPPHCDLKNCLCVCLNKAQASAAPVSTGDDLDCTMWINWKTMKATHKLLFILCPVLVLGFIYYSSWKLHIYIWVQKPRKSPPHSDVLLSVSVLLKQSMINLCLLWGMVWSLPLFFLLASLCFLLVVWDVLKFGVCVFLTLLNFSLWLSIFVPAQFLDILDFQLKNSSSWQPLELLYLICCHPEYTCMHSGSGAGKPSFLYYFYSNCSLLAIGLSYSLTMKHWNDKDASSSLCCFNTGNAFLWLGVGHVFS